MRVRFLQTTPSENPDFPFQPGQVIEVPRLTDRLRVALEHDWAELLHDALEEAVVAPVERAIPFQKKKTK